MLCTYPHPLRVSKLTQLNATTVQLVQPPYFTSLMTIDDNSPLLQIQPKIDVTRDFLALLPACFPHPVIDGGRDALGIGVCDQLDVAETGHVTCGKQLKKLLHSPMKLNVIKLNEVIGDVSRTLSELRSYSSDSSVTSEFL